jgi:hypothetical protein
MLRAIAQRARKACPRRLTKALPAGSLQRAGADAQLLGRLLQPKTKMRLKFVQAEARSGLAGCPNTTADPHDRQ